MSRCPGPSRTHQGFFASALEILALILLGFSGTSRLAAQEATGVRTRRTIVLVVFDTTRRDDVSAYGARSGITPFIDSLARDGLRYDAAFAPDSFTVPSHGALFTGQLIGPEGRLPLDVETLPERMKRLGFKTIGVAANWVLSSESGFTRGFDSFTNAVDEETRKALEEHREPDAERRRESAVASAAASTLSDALKKDVGPDDSLFVFLNFLDPHDPYTPEEPFRSRFARGVSIDGHLRTIDGGLEAFFAKAQRMSSGDRKGLRRLYRAEVSQADAGLHAVEELIKGMGRESETLFVVAADHGELFGERGAWTHNVGLSEEEVHVPLVVHGPGISHAVVTAPVGLADLNLALSGWAEGKGWNTSASRPLLFHHVYPGNEKTSDPLIKTDALSMVDGDWRIIRSGAGCRLFHRAEPYWIEVTCDPEHGKGGQMMALLNDEVRQRIGVQRLRSWIENQPTAEWIKKLRSLGYLGN